MSQLTNLQRVMAAEDLPSASTSSSETKLSALTVKVQCLSPEKDVTKWDIDRFAEPRPHAADKTKYFQYPQWGHISDPATVLDVHGRVMLWYLPGIIPPERVKHLNRIHLPLKGSLVKHSKRKNESSMRFGHRHVPELDGRDMDPLADAIFGHGRLMNSPATFQQGHLRLQDKVYESSNLKIPAVKEWLHEISYAEEFWNSISGLVLPDPARVGKDVIAPKGDWVVTQPPSGTQWPSIYVGIDVIVNQETPPHLDKVSAPSLLDLLVSLGTHDAQFHVWDLGSIFSYQPGTMIYLAGKLLHHSVPKWDKGERIALAHYMKDAVHNRFGLERPSFTQQKDLLGKFYRLSPTKTRRGKLTHKEVDARHLYSPSGSQPSPPGTPRTKASSQHLNFSDFHDSLDIPDSDWNDVDDAPQSRRHTKSQNDYIREWLPWRAEYLNIIMEVEQLARGGFVSSALKQKEVLWRDLKHRKWFGFGHDAGKDPGDGGLALFCPACPQPGLNLPADWKVQYDRDTVMRQYVIDGNFTAQHMKMNKPELDVALSDGKGYMVSEGPYQNHLQQSLDSKERSTCSNHRAINTANINKSNLRSTGIGTTACAQHGCFVPHTVVDFQKGERYMNTDYSICNALGYGSERITKALVIYDVGCQWNVNFWSRVKNSPFLLPPALEIVPGVGKFHLAAHKLSCFPRYSLHFVKGAGHLDGEILETLWAPFDKISPTARSMTQAHRQEVYDDHMRDSNWKKLVGLGEGFFSKEGKFMQTISVPSLLKKYKTSNKCLEEMNKAYEQLTAVLDPDKVSGWELDALRAEADRGEALDIYLLKGDKAPTFHEVQLQLMKNPKSPSGSGGSVTWLAEGLSIEDSQDQLRSELQQLPNPMSTSQEVKISEKRQRLSTRIEKFHSNGQAFFKGLEIDGTFIPQDDAAFCGKEEEEEEDREFWDEDEGYWEALEEEVEEVAYELMSIWIPSSIGSAKLTELGLVGLLKEERELRIGQANDCLDQLRTDLGNKAMLY
ncbi:hypothetical protein F5141DRAFT_1214590 [Pisolithus sp. B1]|nr:hypothetical protein F5141DRAFT_1214590 [Pisolithus sp. B1]